MLIRALGGLYHAMHVLRSAWFRMDTDCLKGTAPWVAGVLAGIGALAGTAGILVLICLFRSGSLLGIPLLPRLQGVRYGSLVFCFGFIFLRINACIAGNALILAAPVVLRRLGKHISFCFAARKLGRNRPCHGTQLQLQQNRRGSFRVIQLITLRFFIGVVLIVKFILFGLLQRVLIFLLGFVILRVNAVIGAILTGFTPAISGFSQRRPVFLFGFVMLRKNSVFPVPLIRIPPGISGFLQRGLIFLPGFVMLWKDTVLPVRLAGTPPAVPGFLQRFLKFLLCFVVLRNDTMFPVRPARFPPAVPGLFQRFLVFSLGFVILRKNSMLQVRFACIPPAVPGFLQRFLIFFPGIVIDRKDAVLPVVLAFILPGGIHVRLIPIKGPLPCQHFTQAKGILHGRVPHCRGDACSGIRIRLSLFPAELDGALQRKAMKEAIQQAAVFLRMMLVLSCHTDSPFFVWWKETARSAAKKSSYGVEGSPSNHSCLI